MTTTKTKSIHGDAQPQAEAEDKDAIPVSYDDWMKPTAGDAHPPAGHTEGQDKSR